MIKLQGLTKYFGEKCILEKVDLEIPDGQSIAIIGPSGCGKSTLLRLLIRLIEPTAGSINIDGEEVTQVSEDGLLRIRRKLGMIFQTAALFDSISVYENVAFGLRERGKTTENEIIKIVKEKLKLVELEGTEQLFPSELSGGMQKRVSIARALAFNPKFILYDEPTTGLDPITSVTIENLMLKLRQELKVTSIIVTHVMQTVNRTAERVLMLHQGKFIDTGTPAETNKSSNPVVKKFITGGL